MPIQQTDIHRWLRNVPKRSDGSIRAIASLWVPGKVVGQFTFNGRRSDDPNDVFPHERRRELRGLRVFAAWLNHDDARAINSIDTYVEEDGRRYIRHSLDRFAIRNGRVPELAFDNAAVRFQIVQQQPEYQIEWAPFDNNAGTIGAIRATLNTLESHVAIPPDVWGPPDVAGFRYAVATISTIQRAFPHWIKPVTVTIRNRSGLVDVVGIDRPITLPDRATG